MSDSESDSSTEDDPFVDADFTDDDAESTKEPDEEYTVAQRESPSPEDFPEDSPKSNESPSNPTTIEWDELLDNPDITHHVIQKATTIEDTCIDVTPPTRRLLSSAGGTPPEVTSINFRLTPTATDAEEQLQRYISDNFEEKIGKAYVRDAIVRVAASHPQEVAAMLAAYGFDQPYE